MADLIKVDCGKCGGTGTINAFRHIHGGRCFSCKGAGHWMRTAASVRRSEKRRAEKRAETERAVAAGAARADAREALYANDPRLGPATRARCERHPVAAFEVYATLAKIDAGEITQDRQPWVFRNLAE